MEKLNKAHRLEIQEAQVDIARAVLGLNPCFPFGKILESVIAATESAKNVDGVSRAIRHRLSPKFLNGKNRSRGK